jgi:hypothetical protein
MSVLSRSAKDGETGRRGARPIKLPGRLLGYSVVQRNRSGKTKDYLKIAAAFLVALLLVVVVTAYPIYYLEQLELQRKIDPPDWLVAPVAISLIGITILLTKSFSSFVRSKLKLIHAGPLQGSAHISM